MLKEMLAKTPETNKERVRELLEWYDKRYYDDGVSEVPDAVYDSIKAQLGKEYDYVPGNAYGVKVNHPNKVLSLDKVNSGPELEKHIERLKPVVTEYKADGMTVVLYPDGRAVTRGNGFIGTDITTNFLKVRGVANTHPPYPVRFEVVIFKRDFLKLKELEPAASNHRNVVAGALGSKDGKYCDLLQAIAITIDAPGMTVSQKHKLIRDLGYYGMPFFGEQSANAIMSIAKDSALFEIDGLVIKSDRPNADAIFGATGHHPNSMIAYKYPSLGKWTELRDVVWQVGRSGRVSPVAVLEPIEIDGVTISRATLHNPGIMDVLNITKGCKVFVERANDVIPSITQSAGNMNGAYSTPDTCPVCRQKLTYREPLLFCTNEVCYAQLISGVAHIAKRDALNIEGLALKTVEQIASNGFLTTPFDLFKLTKEQLLTVEGFADKSATNLIAEINKAKEAPFDRFLYAAGIPEIGRTASREIAASFESLEAFLDDLDKGGIRLQAIQGFGKIMCDTAVKSAGKWRELSKYVKVVYPKQSSAPKEKLTFVITGSLSEPRKVVEELILKAGHAVSSSVSKKTSYVVVGVDPGSKAKTAEELGVKMIGLEELRKLL